MHVERTPSFRGLIYTATVYHVTVATGASSIYKFEKIDSRNCVRWELIQCHQFDGGNELAIGRRMEEMMVCTAKREMEVDE